MIPHTIFVQELCDYGPHCRLIVPPELVVAKTGRTVSAPRRKVISQVVAPDSPDFHPLIVIANRKSGNNDTATILPSFRRQLNPAQVVDLHDTKMEEALEWCQVRPNMVSGEAKYGVCQVRPNMVSVR